MTFGNVHQFLLWKKLTNIFWFTLVNNIRPALAHFSTTTLITFQLKSFLLFEAYVMQKRFFKETRAMGFKTAKRKCEA